MPTVRFSRDKRGYEYVYLVHTPTRRGKPGRTRVLYWYRTPPGVRIGRSPFDEDVQRLLEKQNPGITFDWPTITSAQIPPPDMTEYWRERRRAEKAAKQERRAAEAAEAAEAGWEGENEPDVPETVVAPAPTDDTAPAMGLTEADATATADDGPDGSDDGEGAGGDEAGAATGDSAAGKRRRRRRGGRRRRGASASVVAGAAEAGESATADAGAAPAGNSAAEPAATPSERPDSASEEA